MDRDIANTLIKTLWDIGEQLKAAQAGLDTAENLIADQVPDDDG